MAQTMPWQKYGASSGPITIGTPDPYKAQTRYLDLAMKQAQLAKLKSDLAQQQASDAATIAPNTGVHGEAYLKQLPEGIANEVRAIAEGRMQLPARAMTSPRFQGVMQAVVNYDPSFDAINYNARANVRKDFTSGKSSQNIKALNTAIGHVGQLYDQISGTASHGGNGNILPGATMLNAVENAYSRSRGSAGITNFDQTAGAVASELTQVFRGTSGAEADIQRYLSELNPNASLDQKRGAVKNILGLLNSRLQALGDQYQKGMGTDKYPLDILDDHAKSILTKAGVQFTDPISGNPMGGNGGPPPPAGGPNGGGTPPGSPPGGGASPLDYMTGTPDASLATGAQKGALDTAANALIDRYVRDPNASLDDLNAALRPLGYSEVPAGQWQSARQFQAQHPNYQGSYGAAVKTQPTTLFNRVAAGPVGAFFTGAGDAATGGNLDSLSGNPDAFRAGVNALMSAHPVASTIGQIAGAIPTAAATELGTGAAIGKAGLSALAPYAPMIGDTLYSAGYGAGSNDNNRIAGALTGGLGGTLGGMFGRALSRPVAALARTAPVNAALNAGRRALNLPEVVPPSPLTAGQNMILKAANKGGISDINASLANAQALGVPMSLADTNPNLRELAAAAVRRSPTAAQVAENALIPRGRGQIERFTQSVEQNLGPIGNIPQIADDLTNQARTEAAPLYEQAYAAPGASSEKIGELLQTPFGQQALSRARTIAANEQRDPTSLGFDLDPQGDVILTRVPSMQTLDYVKRGMDDVLEQNRNPITGRLQLDEAGRAQNGVKNAFLSEMDRINPAYAQARAAYAGPAQARDAMTAGQDAFSLPPNTVAQSVANQTESNMPLFQLGYRDSLVNQANRVRYNANPFDATLGNPMAEQRLRTVYPNTPGVDTLLQQRDLEGQLARNTNDIIGNSKTAQRSIADQQFAGDDWPQLALDAGINIATGQVPTSLFLKKGSVQAVKDAFNMGIGKRAVAKADEIAPILFNTDPQASASSLSSLADNLQAYRDFVAAQRRQTGPILGMFGAGLGSSATSGY